MLRGDTEARRTAYASLQLDRYRLRASLRGNLKFLQDYAYGYPTWFNLAIDPKELSPLGSAGQRGESLRTHANRIGTQGLQGFHLLLVNSPEDPITMTGEIRIGDPQGFEFRYPHDLYDAELAGGKLVFEVQLDDPAQRDGSNWTWTLQNSGAARNYAHLFIPTHATSDVAIRILRDGKELSRDAIHVGREMASVALDGAVIPLEQLVANPLDFDPSKLPLEFGVYCYFVLGPKIIADQHLSPEVREALEALGYLE
jgi:hypothetical protein